MANRARRAVFTRVWLAAVLGWSLVRTLVVAGTLRRFGVHPLTYGAVDLAASWPYAVSTGRLATSLLDRRPAGACRWALVAGASFIIPDAYLLTAGRRKPPAVYAIVLGVAASMAALAVVSLVRRLRRPIHSVHRAPG